MEFYDLFEQGTSNLVVAAQKLVDFFDNYENVEAKAKELKDLEHQGDVITHEIIAFYRGCGQNSQSLSYRSAQGGGTRAGKDCG